MRSADKNLVQKGLEEVLEMPETLELVSEDCKDSSILNLKIFFLNSGSSEEKVSSSISFALIIIDPKVVSRELLGPANLT